VERFKIEFSKRAVKDYKKIPLDYKALIDSALLKLSNGLPWEAIIEEWRSVLTKEAISEAIKLDSKALFSHAPKLAVAG